MVIQRVQTLYLFLSAVFMAAFFFVPFGYIAVDDPLQDEGVLAPLTGLTSVATIIPTSVAIFFSLLAIFLFKALPTQKLFVVLSGLVSLAEVVMVIYILVTRYTVTDPLAAETTVWGGGGLFLVGAIILNIAAYRGISHDQRLLRSYDRLR